MKSHPAGDLEGGQKQTYPLVNRSRSPCKLVQEEVGELGNLRARMKLRRPHEPIMDAGRGQRSGHETDVRFLPGFVESDAIVSPEFRWPAALVAGPRREYWVRVLVNQA